MFVFINNVVNNLSKEEIKELEEYFVLVCDLINDAVINLMKEYNPEFKEEDIKFEGEACVIAVSSTSILSSLLLGKNISEVENILRNYYSKADNIRPLPESESWTPAYSHFLSDRDSPVCLSEYLQAAVPKDDRHRSVNLCLT